MPMHCYMVLISNPQPYEAIWNPFGEAMMDKEYNWLIKNQNSELVRLPSYCKLVKFKCVYKKKKSLDALVSRYK